MDTSISIPESPTPRRQLGFGMIEVLVTLVILTVGLLGLASLQLTGLKGINNSLSRTTATMIAAEMAERIRANPSGNNLGSYNSLDTDNVTSSPGCISSSCSSSDVALNDIYEISHYFNNLSSVADFIPKLPDGRLQVQKNGDIFDISIEWLEKNANTPTRFITELRP